MAMHWYVVHAYSGFEKSVMRALKERIERAGMQDRYFGEILVPVEEVVEMKSGQKKTSESKVFPGLCSGADGNERRLLAFGEKYSQSHWFCRWDRQQACSDQ
jgi:hypothetical protein